MRNILNRLHINLPAPLVRMRRMYNTPEYCISHLFSSRGEYICDAIEDTVRDSNHNGRIDNGEVKVYGKTAIPCGRYYVSFRRTGLAKRHVWNIA